MTENELEQYDLDKPLEIEPVGSYLKGKFFYKNPQTAVITGYDPNKRNQWNKRERTLGISIENEEYLLNISLTNQNTLVKLLGGLTKDWLNQIVIIDCPKIRKWKDEEGVEKDGYPLEFSLP